MSSVVSHVLREVLPGLPSVARPHRQRALRQPCGWRRARSLCVRRLLAGRGGCRPAGGDLSNRLDRGALPADTPVSALDVLLYEDPGQGTHVLALNGDHRVGDLLDHLLFLVGGEDPFDELYLDQWHELLLSRLLVCLQTTKLLGLADGLDSLSSTHLPSLARQGHQAAKGPCPTDGSHRRLASPQSRRPAASGSHSR